MVNARCSQTFFLSDIVIALTTCAMVQVKTSGPCAKLEDGHQFSLGFVITHYAWIPPFRGMDDHKPDTSTMFGPLRSLVAAACGKSVASPGTWLAP